MTDFAPEVVAARTVLLDALGALGTQREAIIVVGAQAVYLRTGHLVIAGYTPYTTDADLVLAPSRLADEPHIEALMQAADFYQKGDPGIWWKTVDISGSPSDVEVDIMVPERFAPPGGRRSVRLPPHDRMIARRAIGLEGAILDHDVIEIGALEAEDARRCTARVAGPAALVVAKAFKLRDRLAGGKSDRIADKDAADVYRLMVAVSLPEFVRRLRPLLDDETAGPVCREAVELVAQFFGDRGAAGITMANGALQSVVSPQRVADACMSFNRGLRQELANFGR